MRMCFFSRSQIDDFRVQFMLSNQAIHHGDRHVQIAVRRHRQLARNEKNALRIGAGRVWCRVGVIRIIVFMMVTVMMMLAMRGCGRPEPSGQMDVAATVGIVMMSGQLTRTMRMVPTTPQQQMQGEGEDRE